MIKTSLGAQRYNNRMSKIFAEYKAQEYKKTICNHNNIKANDNLTAPYILQCPDCYLVK